jgi:hypothetical protein
MLEGLTQGVITGGSPSISPNVTIVTKHLDAITTSTAAKHFNNSRRMIPWNMELSGSPGCSLIYSKMESIPPTANST